LAATSHLINTAGIASIAGLVFNPISAKPYAISLPSTYSTHTQIVTLSYASQPTHEAPITFRFNHSRSGAYVVPSKWGTANTAMYKMAVDISANVTAVPDVITLSPGESANIEVSLLSCMATVMMVPLVIRELAALAPAFARSNNMPVLMQQVEAASWNAHLTNMTNLC
jgi:hypothetical protein